jgi:hypothetical protein
VSFVEEDTISDNRFVRSPTERSCEHLDRDRSRTRVTAAGWPVSEFAEIVCDGRVIGGGTAYQFHSGDAKIDGRRWVDLVKLPPQDAGRTGAGNM